MNNQGTNPETNSEGNSLDDTLMTVKEVAALLKVHHTSVYRFIKRESIPAFKIGADWRFSRRAIEKWLRDQQGQR